MFFRIFEKLFSDFAKFFLRIEGPELDRKVREGFSLMSPIFVQIRPQEAPQENKLNPIQTELT